MTTKAKVLVTTAGTIVAQGIIKALKFVNEEKDRTVSYKILSTDMSAEAAGLYRTDVGYVVPPINSPNYLDSVIQICKKNDISALFVGADEELLLMSQSRKRILEESGAFVVTNPEEVIATCIDKWKTYQFLKKNDIPCAASSLPEDRVEFVESFGFPLVVKPREGHGSIGMNIVKDRRELDYAISSIEKLGFRPVVQEFIQNPELEFTTGVTVDAKGQYVMSSISMRRNLKHGQTYKAFIDDFPEVRKVAERAALAIGCIGPINIQGRLNAGELKIFEMNPRFSATCPLRAVAGINEPDIIFRNSVFSEKIHIDGYRKLACFRYWNEVYVPYDTYERTAKERVTTRNDSFIPDYF